MKAASWKALLRRIPREHHHNLMVMTTVGVEFAIQAILRIDEEYIILRGRLSGSTDTGRSFFIPYDQINYLGFQRAVGEETIYGYYGETPPAAIAVTPVGDPDATPTEALPAAELPISEVAPESEPDSKRAPLPGKEALLQRLRSRRSK